LAWLEAIGENAADLYRIRLELIEIRWQLAGSPRKS
jgi:hypothetical protein